MANVRVDFEKSSHVVDKMRNGKFLPGFQEIGCNVIFDINMDGKFTRKSRLVTGGHTTEPPEFITYNQAPYPDIAYASHSCSLR